MTESPDSFYGRINSLCKFLNYPDETGYMFACFTYDGLWREVVSILEDRLKNEGVNLKWLALNNEIDETIGFQIEQAVNQMAAPRALVITGLAGRDMNETMDILSALNFGREWLHEIPAAKVFFITDSTLTFIHRWAVDLYSQRARTTVYFPEQPEIKEVGDVFRGEAESLSLEPLESFRFTQDDKGLALRVKLLERQWQDGLNRKVRKGRLYEDIGLPLAEAYLGLGRMDDAENLLLKLEGYFEGSGREKELGTVLMLLGDLNQDKGKLKQALEYFTRFEANSRSMLTKDPDWEYAKGQLGAAYSKLGDISQAQGKFDQALKYFHQFSELMEELHRSNTQSDSIKNGLAISYSKLGDISQTQGKFDQALKYYHQFSELMEELHRSNPQSESLKNGLAISYSKLGDIYQSLGKFDQALKYYQERSKLGEELHRSNPQSERMKVGLANSYEKLGDFYGQLGNLDEGLKYYQMMGALAKDLYASNPQRVEIKYELFFSEVRLFLILQFNRPAEARPHLLRAHELAQELVATADTPRHREALAWVEARL